MKSENQQKMLTSQYIDTFRKILDDIVLHDDAERALELSRILEKAMEDNAISLKTYPDVNNFYKTSLSRLKLVCLPALNEKEILDLFKNSIGLMLNLPGYDLWSKIKAKLVNIDIINDRDLFKTNLKRVISENGETITPNNPLKTTKEWLKDYLIKVGLDNQDSLKRAQYLSGLKGVKTISAGEYQSLTILLDFYDQLGLSSETPAGFEEEYPVIKDGRLFIFSKGILDPVPVAKDYDQASALLSAQSIPSDSSTSAASVQLKPSTLATPLPSAQPLSKTAELEESLKSYSSSSLEYKAIKQEIGRLNKAGKNIKTPPNATK